MSWLYEPKSAPRGQTEIVELSSAPDVGPSVVACFDNADDLEKFIIQCQTLLPDARRDGLHQDQLEVLDLWMKIRTMEDRTTALLTRLRDYGAVEMLEAAKFDRWDRTGTGF